MPSTVTAIVSSFRTEGFYPDCPSAVAGALFEDVYREVLSTIQIRNTTVSIPLVAGQREYDLSEDVFKVHEAYYEESSDASGWFVLEETSMDALVRLEKGWRAFTGDSRPLRYWTSSTVDGDSGKPVLALDPVPPATTSGTYPRVRLYVTQYAPLTGSETVPSGLLSDDVYLYGMAYKWAVRRDPERAGYWKQLYSDEMVAERKHYQNKLVQAPDIVILSPFIGRTSRAV